MVESIPLDFQKMLINVADTCDLSLGNQGQFHLETRRGVGTPWRESSQLWKIRTCLTFINIHKVKSTLATAPIAKKQRIHRIWRGTGNSAITLVVEFIMAATAVYLFLVLSLETAQSSEGKFRPNPVRVSCSRFGIFENPHQGIANSL